MEPMLAQQCLQRWIVSFSLKQIEGTDNFSAKESSLIVCATEADKCQKDRSLCL